MIEVYAQPSLFEQTRCCTKRGENKLLAAFYKQRNGLMARCADCLVIEQRERYWRDPRTRSRCGAQASAEDSSEGP